MAKITSRRGAGGEILHFIPHPPGALPPVTRRDLEQAWDAASEGAARFAPPQAFRFARPGAEPLDLVLADGDAAAWARAIGQVENFATPHGISVALRVLALVELLGRAAWTRPWFTITRADKRAEMQFHPALLQAAALAPLTDTGGFAETALRALLPGEPPPALGDDRA